ncbi:unnamed protein product, partial [Rotaria sordida]
EERVAQSNGDLAKAFELVELLAKTKGFVTAADMDAIKKQFTGKE